MYTHTHTHTYTHTHTNVHTRTYTFKQDLLKKSQRCMEVIIDAKERQAAEANKNATSLLMEIDQEKVHTHIVLLK